MLGKIDESLKALEVDYVDIVTRGSASSAEDVMNPVLREAMAEARAAGKARFLGVPTHKNEAEVLNALADDKDKFFDVVLVAYNFKKDKAVKEAIARAAKAGIGVIAMKTQAGGYETKELGRHQSASGRAQVGTPGSQCHHGDPRHGKSCSDQRRSRSDGDAPVRGR